MPDAAEAAPVAGYSPGRAAADLLEGAFRSRRPPRRHGVEPLGWGWQLALIAISGFVSGIDIYLREPFKPSDLPPDMVGWLPVLNVLGNPAIAILVAIVSWLLMIVGGRVISFGRYGLRDIGSGIAFGWWSATLPILAAIVAGLAFGLSSDTIATIVIFLVVLHLVPSVAEACDVTIGHAFWVIVLGPLAVLLIVALCLLAFGFSEKLLGLRMAR